MLYICFCKFYAYKYKCTAYKCKYQIYGNALIMLTMSEKTFPRGFNRGYLQLKVGDIAKAREELFDVLEIKTAVSFHQYRKGKIEPRRDRAAAIEAVFARYGITDVWGE